MELQTLLWFGLALMVLLVGLLMSWYDKRYPRNYDVD